MGPGVSRCGSSGNRACRQRQTVLISKTAGFLSSAKKWVQGKAVSHNKMTDVIMVTDPGDPVFILHKTSFPAHFINWYDHKNAQRKIDYTVFQDPRDMIPLDAPVKEILDSVPLEVERWLMRYSFQIKRGSCCGKHIATTFVLDTGNPSVIFLTDRIYRKFIKYGIITIEGKDDYYLYVKDERFRVEVSKDVYVNANLLPMKLLMKWGLRIDLSMVPTI